MQTGHTTHTTTKHAYYRSLFAYLPARISAVIMDFDGVFTDNTVYVDQSGTETVRCSRGDGLMLGIWRDRHPDIPLQVISKEVNPVTQQRCNKLKIPCLHGVNDKPTILKAWLEERSIPLAQIVYIGNDLNDLECMAMVGCAISPADGYSEILDIAHIILQAGGGRGAVREMLEILDLYLSEQSAGVASK